MRIGEVVGTVTLNRSQASFAGARLRLVIPLSLADLTSGQRPQAESIVVWDEMGAGLGQRIAISEGPEAAQPFRPAVKAVDAYCAAILDHLSVETDPR